MNVDREYDETLGQVGLPSRKRYNIFVARATELAATGGATVEHTNVQLKKAQVWAQLAQAEATLLAGEQ